MLPDIRVVIVTIVAAFGLLAVTFALAATLRVAQERASPLQNEIAQRSRLVFAEREDLTIPMLIAEMNADLAVEADVPAREKVALAKTASANDAKEMEVAEVAAEEPATVERVAAQIIPETPAAIETATQQVAALPAPLADETATVAPSALVPLPAPAAEPPMGGPLTDRIVMRTDPDAAAERAAKLKAARLAAAKAAAAKRAAAKKARAVRIARQRKAAARRAAEARAAQPQQTTDPFNTQAPQASNFGAPKAAPRQNGLSGSFSGSFRQ